MSMGELVDEMKRVKAAIDLQAQGQAVIAELLKKLVAQTEPKPK